MKSSQKAKKLDNRWVGLYEILKVYPRSCFVQLPENIRIFPVFHYFFLLPANNKEQFPAQTAINKSESAITKDRVLEREDGEDEPVQKWIFEGVINNHNEDDYHYLIK
ncbi:hypothetical protein BPAE_0783g00010 [Botrytis paeoniae]|uniref:Uncharacterized protein n=1 Tax=Botrytis paeoniae TaxID=278948 RepID=A0A4Z1EUY4_9HELO|nr:hypothetical protein BPAE_0783g00010 [Botrytis paeoniae]